MKYLFPPEIPIKNSVAENLKKIKNYDSKIGFHSQKLLSAEVEGCIRAFT